MRDGEGADELLGQCIKYLEEDVHPLRRQSTAAITRLLDELEKLDLTKAERLQIINLAPTTLVALVVVRLRLSLSPRTS